MINSELSFPYFFLFFLCLLNTTQLKGQQTVSATIHNNDGIPMEYANILLYSASDSIFKKGTITDDQGVFKLIISQPADYYLQVTALNHLSFNSPVFQVTDLGHNFSLKEILLSEQPTELQTIEVTAQRQLFEQKLDHLQINVADNLTLTNGNALTVLGSSPGVEVEETQQLISLNGNNNVKIAINGKIRPVPFSVILELLRSIDSESIQNIELFALAPARFDAEGTGGVININLKKNPANGLNGNYRIGASYGQRPKAFLSAGINFNKNRFNLYANYVLQRPLNTQTITYNRSFQVNGEEKNITNTNLNDTNWWLNNLSVGGDYRISDKTRVGIVFQGYHRYTDTNGKNTTIETLNNIITEELSIDTDEKNTWVHGAINLNLQHKISDKSTLNFDFDYLKYSNDNPSIYFTTLINPNGSSEMESTIFIEKDLPIDIFVGEINQDFRIGKKGRLETGIKGTHSNFFNNTQVTREVSGIQILDPEFSEIFKQKETIFAGFLSLRLPITSALDGKFGLRYEYTDQDFKTENEPKREISYSNFFPSVYLSYQLTEKQKITASYNRRINRPSFNQLAPFVTFLDPQTLYTGNEDLVPAISDLFKLDYSLGRFIFTLQYTTIDQDIFQYQPVFNDVTEIQTFTSLNIPQVENYSLQISLPFQVNSKWNMQYRISGFYERLRFDEAIDPLTTSGFTFFSTQRIKIQKSLNLTVSGNYKTPSFYGLLRVRSRGSLNLGIQKVLKGRGGSLSFSVRDILRTNNWESDSFIPALNLAHTSVFDVENPVFSLSYRNTFGSSTIKKSRNYQGGAGAEKQRVR